MGQTQNPGRSPAFRVTQTPQGKADYLDGSTSENCLIFGTYLHGLFHNSSFTRALIGGLLRSRNTPDSPMNVQSKSDPYNELADMVRQNLNIPEVYRIMQERVIG